MPSMKPWLIELIKEPTKKALFQSDFCVNGAFARISNDTPRSIKPISMMNTGG